MKILMTADTVGGVWTYALELAGALKPHGAGVALATMGAPLSPQQWVDTAVLDNLEVYESDYKLEWMDEPWEDLARAGEWLLHLEQQLRPDIIHLNGYVHGVLPWQAPTVVVGHSCVLSWWQAVRAEPVPAYWNRYAVAVERGIKAADLVVAPTQAMLNELDCLYGPLPASRVIHNGRDSDLFAPAPKEPFILVAGRLWDEAKNVATLARAAARLPWPVYIAGAEQHPDGKPVHFENVRPLGLLNPPCLASWLGRAAIYALPARYEPFGLSALEAALSGCALVLGDIPSLREVWGDCATFVPPDDTEALATALNSLIADEAMRTTRARRARERARAYTAARMAADYMAVYGELKLQWMVGASGGFNERSSMAADYVLNGRL